MVIIVAMVLMSSILHSFVIILTKNAIFYGTGTLSTLNITDEYEYFDDRIRRHVWRKEAHAAAASARISTGQLPGSQRRQMAGILGSECRNKGYI